MPEQKLYPIDPYPKVIINAAITGLGPMKGNTPHIPISEDEMVKDAVACRKAGASIVHLHIREEKESPRHKAEKFKSLIKRIRGECDIIICVSTSAAVFTEFDHRSAVLDLKGDEKPEMASLTLGSFNFPNAAYVNSPEIIAELAGKMLKNGIKPELEIFDSGMLNYARALDKKLSLPKPLYFNFLLGSLGGMQGRPRELSYLVQNMPDDSVWSAAGIGVFQLPVNAAALVKGGGVRVGLEDNIYYDYEKKILATNEQLIQRIVRIAKELRREIAGPDEVRRILNLRQRR